MHEVLINRLGGLSLPRKSVVRLTDRPDMTIDVYRGCKTTIQQQQSKGQRKRDRQKKRWEDIQDNIKEWTGMDFASSTRAAGNRTRRKGIVIAANSSVVARQPSKSIEQKLDFLYT